MLFSRFQRRLAASGADPERPRSYSLRSGPVIRRAPGEAVGAPEALRNLEALVARVEPFALVGALAMSYGTAQPGTNPEFNRPLGVHKSHIELVQVPVCLLIYTVRCFRWPGHSGRLNTQKTMSGASSL